MDGNKLMQQVAAIFFGIHGFFSTSDVGIFLVFIFDRSYLDKAVRVIMGSTFIFYGLYRAYRSYVKISSAFFGKGRISDEEFD